MALHLDVEAVYRSHGHVVLRRASQILGSEIEAHEVLQAVFASLVDRPSQFRGESNVSTFLYRMTSNHCLTKLRNSKTRQRILAREASSRSEGASNGAFEKVSASQLLAHLPRRMQEVAIYYHVDGMSHEEIAGVLKCSRRNVGKILRKVQEIAKEVTA